MYLLEHQAKEYIRGAGLATPVFKVADSADRAETAVREIGGACVVKAQVRAGGRGRAGLIRVVKTPEAARAAAAEMLGRVHQGEVVELLMVEERLDIAAELYLGLVLDSDRAAPLALISRRGGVDIETVARTDPEAVVRLELDPLAGEPDAKAWIGAWQRAGLEAELVADAVEFSLDLERVFRASDAMTLEINPLAVTAGGRMVAADCKLITDDAADFRQPELAAFRPPAGKSLEERGAAIGVVYVSLNPGGTVGVMAGGAGLSMATMDEVTDAGALPAAFIDLGGGISEDNMAAAIRLMLATGGLKGLIINVFGGINNCQTMARGIRRVWDRINGRVELVVKMRGHSQDEGWAIVEELGVPVVKLGTTTGAVELLMDRLGNGGGQC